MAKSDNLDSDRHLRGFVYVIGNEMMKEIVKIGFSRMDPVRRAREFRSTATPFTHVVHYHALVNDPHTLETQIHQTLSLYRKPGGEWFATAVLHAVTAIQHIAGPNILYEDLEPRWHPAQPKPDEWLIFRLRREQRAFEGLR